MFSFFWQFHWTAHVFIVGVAIAATCSLISPYIVLRRMALISEGVSHAGFGGIGLAILLACFLPALNNDVANRVITGIFCLITALLIAYVTRARKVTEDSAIGIFLVASVALGDLFLSIRAKLPANGPRPASVEQLLFGNFLAVGPSDDVLALLTMLFCFLAVGLLFWQFLYTSLDEEMARVNGVATRAINFLMLFMISLVIVIGVRMVGFLMITAMTIIPGATANMISRRFSGVLIASLAIGVFGTLGALLLVLWPQVFGYAPTSVFARLSECPPGPILVLTLFLIFSVTWLLRHLVKPKVVVPASEA
jgi:zinc transport system permease protein